MKEKNVELNCQEDDSGRSSTKIFYKEVALDTDVMDFLLITGFGYWNSPIYQNATIEKKMKILEQFKNYRDTHSRQEKGLESRLWKGLIHEGGYKRNRHTTLGELKKIVEEDGIVFKQVGYKSFAHFNKALKRHGIKPFKIGGKFSYEKILVKYGLEAKNK